MTAAMLQTSYGNFHQLQDYNGSHGNLQEVFFSVGSQRAAVEGRLLKSKSPTGQSYDHYYGLPDENNYHFQLNLQPMRREFFNNNNNNNNNFETAYADNHQQQQQQQTTKLSSCNKKSFNDVMLKDHSTSSPSISPTHSTDKPPHDVAKFSPRMSEVPHQNLFFHNPRQHRYPAQNYSSHIQAQDKFSFSNHGNIYYSNEPAYYSQFNYCQTDSLFFSPTSHRLNSSDKNHSPSGAYIPSCYPSVGVCGGEDQPLSQTQNSFQTNASAKCSGLKPSPPLMSSSMSEVVAAAVAAATQQRGNGDMNNTDCDPRDLEAFAEHFKQRRIKLGATQADVGAALGKLKLPGVGSLSQSTICRFESLTLSHNNMVALKPVLQAWLCEAENAAREARMREEYLNSIGDGSSSEFVDKKRKRTSIAGPEKRSLEAYFAIQPRPSGEKIAQIADKLDLRKNVVRVWFCNQRQKQKRMKFSATSLKSSH